MGDCPVDIMGNCKRCGKYVTSTAGCNCQNTYISTGTLPIIDRIDPSQDWIDATPDGNYALRILRYYRKKCDARWATDTIGGCDNPIFRLMNDGQEKRAKELDDAINKLVTYFL
jgi:hypothetical protein